MCVILAMFVVMFLIIYFNTFSAEDELSRPADFDYFFKRSVTLEWRHLGECWTPCLKANGKGFCFSYKRIWGAIAKLSST